MRLNATTDSNSKIVTIHFQSGYCICKDIIDEISAMLKAQELKAVLISINNSQANFSCMSEAKKFAELLKSATIPTAAVFLNEADELCTTAVSGCLFQYPTNLASFESTTRDALLYLKTIVEKRPARQIRAVMTSVNNADAMPLKQALLKETELFAGLSKQNLKLSENKK